MNSDKKLIGWLVVFIAACINYESQISHVPTATVANWTLHEWAGALINVALAAAISWEKWLIAATKPATPPPAATPAPSSSATPATSNPPAS